MPNEYRIVGTLTSFGAEADHKHVKKSPFTLQGNNGAWVTIPADQYRIERRTGLVIQRDLDDSNNFVDWETYDPEFGGGGWRVTYTIDNNGAQTTYTNESIAFAEEDGGIIVMDSDGAINAGLLDNLLVVDTDLGNAVVTSGKIATTLQSDNFSAGISGWRITRDTGNAEFNDITARGTIVAGAGSIGGFDIGTDYLRDVANSFGLASTVTGGDDVRFWAGNTFANRASAPLQLYESGYIFAKDIVLAKGALTSASGATGYGYAVNPLFLCHYDGAKPYETDYYGSNIGHNGQAGTYKYGATELRGAFREGKFGKAVQVAAATTNLCKNPSFENNTTDDTGFGQGGSGGSVTRDTGKSYYGLASAKIIAGTSWAQINNGTATSVANGASVSLQCRMWCGGNPSGNKALIFLWDSTNSVIRASGYASLTGEWELLNCVWTNNTGGSVNIYGFAQNAFSDSTTAIWVDGIQLEQTAYMTPYCDGSLGDGHAWAGTAHNSTSSRTAATLTYPASGNINLAQGTVSFWYFQNPTSAGYPSAFGARIDANNYLVVNLAAGGALTPYAESKSGGTGITTGIALTAAAGMWHHIAVTWASGALKFYLDGEQSGSTGNYVAPVGTLSLIEIGSFNLAGQANTVVDDVAILPVALSDHEIKSIYYSDAPLMLAVSNQELRLSGAGLGEVFGNANGLFARDASGNSSFGLLNGTVNANTWGGDSESFDSGDFMFGSNKANKSNLYWDASTGQLQFRAATSKLMYVDTTGRIVVTAVQAATDTPILRWTTAGGVTAGSVSAYVDSVNDVGLAELRGKGTSGGDVGISQLLAANNGETKYAYAQITSDGEFYVNLQSGKQVGGNAQRMRIAAVHDASGTVSEVIAIQSARSSGSTAAGFGSRITFYAANAGGTQTYQGEVKAEFTGGTTNSNLVLVAQNQVKFYHQGGNPTVTGSRGGNAALADLLTELSNIGLITDNSTA